MSTRIQQADNGDGFIVLPDELLEQMGIEIGATVHLVVEFVGNTKCLVLSTTPRIPDRIDELVEHWGRQPDSKDE